MENNDAIYNLRISHKFSRNHTELEIYSVKPLSNEFYDKLRDLLYGDLSQVEIEKKSDI